MSEVPAVYEAPQPVPEIGPGAPLPHHLRIVAEKLALIAESCTWDLPQVEGRPLQGQALRDWTSARHDQIAQHTTELGLGLMMIKMEMGHGGWLGWLQEAGIPQRTASDAIQLARLVFGAPAAAVPVLTALPRRKFQALAPGGQDLLAALTEDGTLAEVPDMSREEIRILVRERMETARLRESLHTMVSERDEARERLKSVATLPPTSRRLAALRLAALEGIEAVRSAGLGLQAVLNELDLEAGDPDEAGFDAAAHAVVYGLQGLYATAVDGLDRAYALREHYTPGQQLPPPLYSEDESQLAGRWAAQFQADAGLRGAQLAARPGPQPTQTRKAQPKGRGRK